MLRVRIERRLGLAAHVALVALLAPAIPVRAGVITLETTLRTTVADTVQTTITVRNAGTDTAHDVSPRLRFDGVERTGALVRELAPRTGHEWTVESPRPTTRGRYPLLVTVAYEDPGFRSFSALSATLVDVDGVFPARLHGSVSPLAVDAEGTLTVVLVNDDTVLRKALVGVFLPDELGGFRALDSRDLPPGKPQQLTAPIQNHGGLAGSRYAIYAVVEIHDGDHSTAALLPGQVEIVSSLAVDWGTYLPRAAIALGGLWALAAVIVALRARRRTPVAASPRTPRRRA